MNKYKQVRMQCKHQVLNHYLNNAGFYTDKVNALHITCLTQRHIVPACKIIKNVEGEVIERMNMQYLAALLRVRESAQQVEYKRKLKAMRARATRLRNKSKCPTLTLAQKIPMVREWRRMLGDIHAFRLESY